jgi:hypothetical protein
MEKTITIRLDRKKDLALTRRARERGKTKSEFLRELIDKALVSEPLGRRVGHLAGSIELPSPDMDLLRQLKERNWRE